MEHNSSVYKQTTGQNQTKLFKMFIFILKIIPWDSQANESNFEQIDLRQILHTNKTIKTFVETLIAKALVLVILRPWH